MVLIVCYYNKYFPVNKFCQTMSEKRQTVSDKLQNKFIILYLSAIELTCQTMLDSVRQFAEQVFS